MRRYAYRAPDEYRPEVPEVNIGPWTGVTAYVGQAPYLITDFDGKQYQLEVGDRQIKTTSFETGGHGTEDDKLAALAYIVEPKRTLILDEDGWVAIDPDGYRISSEEVQAALAAIDPESLVWQYYLEPWQREKYIDRERARNRPEESEDLIYLSYDYDPSEMEKYIEQTGEERIPFFWVPTHQLILLGQPNSNHETAFPAAMAAAEEQGIDLMEQMPLMGEIWRTPDPNYEDAIVFHGQETIPPLAVEHVKQAFGPMPVYDYSNQRIGRPNVEAYLRGLAEDAKKVLFRGIESWDHPEYLLREGAWPWQTPQDVNTDLPYMQCEDCGFATNITPTDEAAYDAWMNPTLNEPYGSRPKPACPRCGSTYYVPHPGKSQYNQDPRNYGFPFKGPVPRDQLGRLPWQPSPPGTKYTADATGESDREDTRDPVKCPQCGGHTYEVMHVEDKTGMAKMRCRSCGNEYKHKGFQNPKESFAYEDPEGHMYDDMECSACGSTFDGDDFMATRACPNCGADYSYVGQIHPDAPNYRNVRRRDLEAATANMPVGQPTNISLPGATPTMQNCPTCGSTLGPGGTCAACGYTANQVTAPSPQPYAAVACKGCETCGDDCDCGEDCPCGDSCSCKSKGAKTAGPYDEERNPEVAFEQPWKCPNCGRLLYDDNAYMGEIQCHNCGDVMAISDLQYPTGTGWYRGTAGFKDISGNPLEMGKWYTLKSKKYRVPDIVQVVTLTPQSVIATVEGDTDSIFPIKVTAEDLERDGFSFEPYDDAQMSFARVEHGIFVEARRNFTKKEQQELIEEEGSARNIDKLNLEGTHYRVDESADDPLALHFLW